MPLSIIIFMLFQQGFFTSVDEANFCQKWLSARRVPETWQDVQKEFVEAKYQYSLKQKVYE